MPTERDDDGFETVSEDETPSALAVATVGPSPASSRSSAALVRRPVRPAKRRKAIQVHKRPPTEKTTTPSSPKRAELPPVIERLLVRPLEVSLLVILRLVRVLFSPAVDILRYGILVALTLCALVWVIQQPFAMLRGAMSFPLLLGPNLLHASEAMLRGPKTMYCSTIGLGCAKEPEQDKYGQIAILARTTAVHASTAHDIFQSVVRLGDPGHLGLHHVGMWTLGIAVRATSTLESKEELGKKLMELGDLSRDVKDRIVSISAGAVGAFTWTLERFKRIEVMIESGSYPAQAISGQLDALYESLGFSLDEVLDLIEQTMPEAERASTLGKSTLFDFSLEGARLKQQREDTPLWRFLLDQTSYKGKQLSRDLTMTGESVERLGFVVAQLDDLRSALRAYRNNAARFRAGVTGMHLADNLLSPEDEVLMLKSTMDRFTSSIDAVKRGKWDAEEKQLPAVDTRPLPIENPG